MEMEMEIYVFASSVLFAAGFLAGLAGFGAALLSVPMLGLFLDIKAVVPITGLVTLAAHAFVLFQLWEHFEFKKVRPLIFCAIPGIYIGLLVLKFASKEIIQAILGATLVVYSLYNVLDKSKDRKRKKNSPYLFSLLSGFLGGAIGTSGPPIIVYAYRQNWSKDLIKVTIQAYFILSGLLVLIGQVLTGLITATVIRIFLASLPALVLGTYLGSILYARSREEDYRKLVLSILAFLGLLMLYRACS
jgi:uncharacterized membrane protein YfcA